MKQLALAAGALALGLVAIVPARADYAVVMFKGDGHCRPWLDSKAAPVGAYKYHWVGLKSWKAAASKKHYAMKHHWCKSFYP